MPIHTSLQQNAKPVSHNRFIMWRCVITMAHADGFVSSEEDDYLRKVFSRMGFSDEQRDVLEEDLRTPQDTLALLKQINDPACRSDVIYFARLLAFKDGNLHPSEDELLKKIHMAVTDGIDMKEIRRQVHENVQSEMVRRELEADAQRPMKGLFGLVDRFLLHLGIDLMD